MGGWPHSRRTTILLGLVCSGALLIVWFLFGGTPMVRGFNLLNLTSFKCQLRADEVAKRFIPLGSSEAHVKEVLADQGFQIWPDIPRSAYTHKESDNVLGATKHVWSPLPFGSEYRTVVSFRSGAASHVEGYIFCQHL